MGAPTEVWSADFKGHYKTGDGRSCDALTISAGYSRFLLAGQALSSTRVQEAKPVFTCVFNACGLPQRIRPDDNGVWNVDFGPLPLWCPPRRREEPPRACACLVRGRFPTEARKVEPTPAYQPEPASSLPGSGAADDAV
jgi:hypothetical protein